MVVLLVWAQLSQSSQDNMAATPWHRISRICIRAHALAPEVVAQDLQHVEGHPCFVHPKHNVVNGWGWTSGIRYEALGHHHVAKYGLSEACGSATFVDMQSIFFQQIAVTWKGSSQLHKHNIMQSWSWQVPYLICIGSSHRTRGQHQNNLSHAQTCATGKKYVSQQTPPLCLMQWLQKSDPK